MKAMVRFTGGTSSRPHVKAREVETELVTVPREGGLIQYENKFYSVKKVVHVTGADKICVLAHLAITDFRPFLT